MQSFTPAVFAVSILLTTVAAASADTDGSSAGAYSSHGGSIRLMTAADAASTTTDSPAAPSGLSAAVNDTSQVILSWSGAAETVEGFNVYRNNAYHGTVRDTSYTDRSVSRGARYTYSLVAFTTDNRFSLRSSSIDVDTGEAASTDQPADDAAGETSPDEQPSIVPGDTPTAADDTPVTEPAAGSPGGVPAGYNLVFSDEFRGTSLDTSKWDSKYRWGSDLIVNNEAQYYVDQLSNPDFGHQPFQFDGENLTINAIPTPDFLRSGALNQPYLSGAMTTYNKFSMRYGYIEMRAKMPGGKGLWPAFWMLHQQNGGTRPEIDIVEYIGDRRTVAYNTYHWYENNTSLQSTPTYEAPGPDYSQGFHTYGVRWEPGRLVWYVDGAERNSYSSGSVASEDMYILLNLALGGGWAGNPDGSTPFPASLVVDYVRAYQP